MRVFQFFRASDGLAAITQRRLKISRIDNLNDPFEFPGADLSHPAVRLVLRRTKRSLGRQHGPLCFSGAWKNPVLWGHYAEKHKGLSLGFEMAAEGRGEYYYPFSSDLQLKQVLVGAESALSRRNIAEALGTLSAEVEVSKVRAAFRSFKVVRQKNEGRWT